MKIVKDKISIIELKKMTQEMFGNFTKAVVDVQNKTMAVDAELHSDEEAILLANGSRQQDLWGINLYPELEGPDWIEFDSMINIRPSQGNRSRGIDDPKIKKKIIEIVNNLVER